MTKRRIVTIHSPASIDVVSKILRDVSDTYPDAYLQAGRSSYDVWVTEPLSNVPDLALTPRWQNSKQERNDALIDDHRNGATSSELAARYGITTQRVSQILRREGEDPALRLMQRHEARREANREARMTACRVCSNQFERRGSTSTCSTACAEALRLGRRYLEPGAYEKHRQYVGATKPPNRRYAKHDSAVVRALIAVGRTDVLPPMRTPKPLNPPCAATNRNGTACNRHAGDGDDLCHIHRAIRDGDPIHLRRRRAS